MRRTRIPSAFTILEVVVALAVAAIALLALLRLHLGTIGLCQRAEMVTLATQLAQAKIAEIQAAGFPPLGRASGSIDRDGHTLSWQTLVAPLNPSVTDRAESTGLRSVSIDVTWPQGGEWESLHLEGAIANGTLP